MIGLGVTALASPDSSEDFKAFLAGLFSTLDDNDRDWDLVWELTTLIGRSPDRMSLCGVVVVSVQLVERDVGDFLGHNKSLEGIAGDTLVA